MNRTKFGGVAGVTIVTICLWIVGCGSFISLDPAALDGGASSVIGLEKTIGDEAGIRSTDANTFDSGTPDDAGQGFTCDSGQCVFNKQSYWTAYAWEATLDPSSSTDAGANDTPDPLMCIYTANSSERCSTSQMDSFAPTWHESLLTTTAQDFLDGTYATLVQPGSATAFCTPVALHPTQEDFVSGILSAPCGAGGKNSIQVRLVFKK